MTDFKILSDTSHIRARFSMYGGSQVPQEEQVFLRKEFQTVVMVSGLLKVINEIIDNSVDEWSRTKGEFSDKIHVNIDQDGYVTVKDNGRGIPSNKIETPDGEEYQMVAAFTRARAGSNFDDSKRDSIGANGVGSMITFVTSSYFEAKSSDGVKEITLIGKNGSIESITEKACNKRGTIVKFKPDYGFFGLETIDDVHIEMIEERMKSLSMAFEGIKFKFNNVSVNPKFTEYFGDCDVFNTEKCTFGITKSNGAFQTHSLVNGLSVKAGTHVDYIISAVIEEMRALLLRRKKVKITAAKLKQHLRFHMVVNGFNALRFDSQTKERITNSITECREAIGEFNATKVANKLMANTSLIDEIAAYTKLSDELAAQKDLAKLEKSKDIKSDKYFPAIGETKRLVVCEGDSAAGSMIKCLGRSGSAYYALKGVPLNVLEVSHQKFIANKELSELYAIINAHSSAEIIIATDADADGSRIRGLLMLFMNKYFKDRIEAGKLKVLRTPIAIARQGNTVKQWAYTMPEVNTLPSNLRIQYQKGLGSWNVADLRYVIETDTIEKMLPVVSVSDSELFYKWFSSETSDFRKEQILQSQPFNISRV